MPLPFAPPPSQSKVYRDLKNITLEDLTPDQFDTLKTAVFAQGVDGAEDEYRRLLLLGLVSDNLTFSGPIPGTLSITETDTGSTADTKVIIFRPADDGSIWQIVDVSFNQVDGGSYNWLLEIGNGSEFVSLIDRGSTSDGAVQFDLWPGAPQYVDYDNYLTGHFLKVSGGTLTESTGKVLAVKVRG